MCSFKILEKFGFIFEKFGVILENDIATDRKSVV